MSERDARVEAACPFCRIAQHDPDAQIEVAVGDSIVITPLNPVTAGHKLVIPLDHVPDAAVDPRVTASVMRDAAVYLRERNVGDCNIITSIGPAATQTVFHLHVHVVPRVDDDGLALPWSRVALAAADAVQGGRTVYDCAHSNARYAQPCDRCPAQPADDRRMVDLDAVISVLSGSWGEPLPSDYGIAAAELVEREFGGSAPSEDQP